MLCIVCCTNHYLSLLLFTGYYHSVGYVYPPLGVPADLQCAVKKCPNLFMLWGYVIPNNQDGSCIVMGLGDFKSTGLVGRTFFYDGLQIRRDA